MDTAVIRVEPQTVTDLLRVLDLAGVLANALLGGVIARREKLDPVGFVTLAVLSGLGGGLIRVNAATGELLRELVLDPSRDYQPTGAPKGPAPRPPK